MHKELKLRRIGCLLRLMFCAARDSQFLVSGVESRCGFQISSRTSHYVDFMVYAYNQILYLPHTLYRGFFAKSPWCFLFPSSLNWPHPRQKFTLFGQKSLRNSLYKW